MKKTLNMSDQGERNVEGAVPRTVTESSPPSDNSDIEAVKGDVAHLAHDVKQMELRSHDGLTALAKVVGNLSRTLTTRSHRL